MPAEAARRICGGVHNAIFLTVVFRGAGRVEASSSTTRMWGGGEQEWRQGDYPTVSLLGVLLDCEGAIGWAEAIHLGYTEAPTVRSGVSVTLASGIGTRVTPARELLSLQTNAEIPTYVASLLSSLLRTQNPVPDDWVVE